jgi:hypothetical protein
MTMSNGQGQLDLGAANAEATWRPALARLLRASGLVWVLVALCVVAALVSDAFLNRSTSSTCCARSLCSASSRSA